MKRGPVLRLAAMALLLGSIQLAAHDDKIHKATVGAVAAPTANGIDLKTKDGIVKVNGVNPFREIRSEGCWAHPRQRSINCSARDEPGRQPRAA